MRDPDRSGWRIRLFEILVGLCLIPIWVALLVYCWANRRSGA